MKRLALLLLLAGCHEPFSNEDILFLLALPRDVQFDVPGEADSARGLRPAQASIVEPARFYRDMVRTSTETNEGIFGVLRHIEAITSSAAIVRQDDRRAWGPIRPDEAQPFELLLVVDRIRTATTVMYTSLSTPRTADEIYRYAFSGRATSTSAWAQLMYGESIVLSADEEEATGYFCLDLDQIQMLDPNDRGNGSYCASYDFSGDRQTVELAVRVPGSIYVNPDAAFSLHREADGSGRFFFSQRGNVFPEEDPSVPEISSVTVRWDETLAARADVSVCGGNAPYELWAVECWDDRFLRSFFLSNFPDPNFVPFGSIQGCPVEFQEPDALAQPCRE